MPPRGRKCNHDVRRSKTPMLGAAPFEVEGAGLNSSPLIRQPPPNNRANPLLLQRSPPSLRILVTRPRIEQNHPILRSNPSRSRQFPRRANGSRTFRRGKNSLQRSQLLSVRQHLLVAHRQRRTARLPQHSQNHPVAQRPWHTQSRSHRRARWQKIPPNPLSQPTPLQLARNPPPAPPPSVGRSLPDPAHLLHLVKCLAHSD